MDDRNRNKERLSVSVQRHDVVCQKQSRNLPTSLFPVLPPKADKTPTQGPCTLFPIQTFYTASFFACFATTPRPRLTRWRSLTISCKRFARIGMSGPTEFAHNAQVLKEIESKAAFSAQQLQIVRGQMASKQREKRMLELSSKELAGLPGETPVYDGVGKM